MFALKCAGTRLLEVTCGTLVSAIQRCQRGDFGRCFVQSFLIWFLRYRAVPWNMTARKMNGHVYFLPLISHQFPIGILMTSATYEKPKQNTSRTLGEEEVKTIGGVTRGLRCSCVRRMCHGKRNNKISLLRMNKELTSVRHAILRRRKQIRKQDTYTATSETGISGRKQTFRLRKLRLEKEQRSLGMYKIQTPATEVSIISHSKPLRNSKIRSVLNLRNFLA